MLSIKTMIRNVVYADTPSELDSRFLEPAIVGPGETPIVPRAIGSDAWGGSGAP